MRQLAAMSGWSVMSAISFAAILFSSSIVFAQTDTAKPIGNYTLSKGTVTVTHPGQRTAVPVKVRDGVLFRDLIVTGPESRTKALFIDDSILTLGENSSMEITEHVFDPNTDKRSAIVNLLKGKLRVLVGKTFLGLGSKFEIHTKDASIAARGTYMVIWIEPGAEARAVPASYLAQAPTPGGTGVALLNGSATFTTPQGSVTVPAGQFSFAAPGTPPSVPTSFSNAPSVQQQIAATNVQSESSPAETSSTETLSSQGQSNTVLVETPSGPTPGVTPTGGTGGTTTDGGDTGDATSGGTTGSPGTTTTTTGPTGPTTTATAPTVTAPTVPVVPVVPFVPVQIQMEPEMTRMEAAIMGGRQPTGTLTLDLGF